jgi:glycosyl transferase family 25
MKAYCINLDRRPDRLEHVTAEFRRAGLAFERLPAVDARDPAVAAAAARLPVSFRGIRISAGAYACLQSHRLAWQRLLDSGDRLAAVFEDDVILAPDLGFLALDDWVPGDAELVKLETFRVRVHLSRRRIDLGGGNALARLQSTQMGSAGYVIRSDVARRLLDLTEVTGDPVDEIMFNTRLGFAPGAVIYQMIPAPAVQGDRVPPEAGGVLPAWQATSITERHAEGKAALERPEIPVERLLRRLREEIRARALGTRYQVVPHRLLRDAGPPPG